MLLSRPCSEALRLSGACGAGTASTASITRARPTPAAPQGGDSRSNHCTGHMRSGGRGETRELCCRARLASDSLHAARVACAAMSTPRKQGPQIHVLARPPAARAPVVQHQVVCAHEVEPGAAGARGQEEHLANAKAVEPVHHALALLHAGAAVDARGCPPAGQCMSQYYLVFDDNMG